MGNHSVRLGRILYVNPGGKHICSIYFDGFSISMYSMGIESTKLGTFSWNCFLNLEDHEACIAQYYQSQRNVSELNRILSYSIV